MIELPSTQYAFEVHRGVMTNSIQSQASGDAEAVELVMSGRFKKHFDQISEEFGFQKVVSESPKVVALSS